MSKKGYKEITLLGQNVNSYGKDLKEDVDFCRPLTASGWYRGTLSYQIYDFTPRDFNDRIIDIIANGEKICEHFHLPVQSGSNKILKLMNRGYTRDYYLELIDKIRSRVANCSITSDIIVGFPGEKEKDFKDTLDLMQKVQFDAYIFIYSPRKGTKSSEMAIRLALK